MDPYALLDHRGEVGELSELGVGNILGLEALYRVLALAKGA